MLLASYRGTRPGLQGVANVLIRSRLAGEFSHTEIVFEPEDLVGMFMPDGTCAEVDGALWSASSVAAERLPAWSQRRAGRWGGVRLKRIAFEPDRWELIRLPGDPITAAAFTRAHEGAPYDWSLIAQSIAWFIPAHQARFTCSEFVAAAAQFSDAWRFDPCNLRAAVKRLSIGA